MPRACTVCASPQRPDLDAALTTGRESLRALASRYAVNFHALHRHQTRHLDGRSTPDAPTSTTRPVPSTTLSPMARRAKQRVFLQALRRTGQKLTAAKAAGVDASTPFRWAARDARFAEKMAEAQAQGDQVDLARCTGLLKRRIRNVKDPASAILLMFHMKKLEPRYRENGGMQLAVTGPVSITFERDPGPTPQPVGVEGHARTLDDGYARDLA